MPWLLRLSATVTMSRLPVRSPLPKSVPSTRSAPASRPSSVAATPVPRSLWVCREMMTDSRFVRFRHIHSIWSAWTLGVVHSTVAGRLRMIFFSGVGCQTSITAWQHSSEKSSSVSENDSGEYWSTISVSGTVGDEFLDQLRALDGDVADRLARGVAEGDAALQRRGGVVDMHDGAPRSGDRFEGVGGSGGRASAPAPGSSRRAGCGFPRSGGGRS